jgi:hypothetical protein
MKPFDLQKALAGAPVITMSGEKVVELHHLKATNKLAVIREDFGQLSNSWYGLNGSFYNTKVSSPLDLVMATTKKHYWVDVLRDSQHVDALPFSMLSSSIKDRQCYVANIPSSCSIIHSYEFDLEE